MGWGGRGGGGGKEEGIVLISMMMIVVFVIFFFFSLCFFFLFFLNHHNHLHLHLLLLSAVAGSRFRLRGGDSHWIPRGRRMSHEGNCPLSLEKQKEMSLLRVDCAMAREAGEWGRTLSVYLVVCVFKGTVTW